MNEQRRLMQPVKHRPIILFCLLGVLCGSVVRKESAEAV